ncbi:hypothetical protein [Pontibacillus yanchengensis]|uniref:Membrane protein n=1 Tax=Pontibacillus yanchengensis Y32 TaxID=1385514 RepID=A0A0A2TEN1_9BACI|nr:hypothetical protein [Pontibacillus yanchengensis]KGP74292.1 membrane protein [Pontibacillus yanchengensis Y32]
MSFILLMGLIGIVFLLYFKKPILSIVSENHGIVSKLQDSKWFQDYRLAGVFLFGINAVLFISTILMLYGLTLLTIPYVHLIIMLFAVVVSIYFWLVVHKSWKGSRMERVKMSLIGISFYIGSTLLFIYWLVTLTPSYPGEDTFIIAIGLILAIIVTSVACIVCFIITGITKDRLSRG